MRCQTVELSVTDLDAGIRLYSGFLGFAPQLRDTVHAVWKDINVCLTLRLTTRHVPPFLL